MWRRVNKSKLKNTFNTDDLDKKRKTNNFINKRLIPIKYSRDRTNKRRTTSNKQTVADNKITQKKNPLTHRVAIVHALKTHATSANKKNEHKIKNKNKNNSIEELDTEEALTTTI